ncbi:hypothetical protein DEO72_LG8g2237 [Vigna unguiculata]|uniref:Uncharacterized protein n=1 Tax=Vigna unguiculata TaxID=3917 RepID=A0A4D6MTW5_VIGUN|nr:hypothetical protein DEO72_LG8g2237 [Vigna unguiculata]
MESPSGTSLIAKRRLVTNLVFGVFGKYCLEALVSRLGASVVDTSLRGCDGIRKLSSVIESGPGMIALGSGIGPSKRWLLSTGVELTCGAWRRYCEAKNVSLELWLGIGVKHVVFLELWLRITSLELWLGMADKHEELLSWGSGVAARHLEVLTRRRKTRLTW